MNTLFAAIGVIAGVMITGSVGFWSTRRQELERAVVAATLLLDEMTLDLEGPAHLATLRKLWEEQRGSLVLYLQPQAFSALNKTILRATSETPPDDIAEHMGRVLADLQTQTRRLRRQHQEFILTPLVRYVRSAPWRRTRHEPSDEPSWRS